jgi:hypothetical protein
VGIWVRSLSSDDLDSDDLDRDDASMSAPRPEADRPPPPGRPECLEKLPRPVIAAYDGDADVAALEILAARDVRLPPLLPEASLPRSS